MVAYARVSATNIKGTSNYSAVGFGGVIQKSPDAPVNLINVEELTNAVQITIKWE
jgi:hypothetical protein